MTGMDSARIKAQVREGLAEGLNTSAERVRAVAVPLTPEEIGDLRSSLTVVPATEGDLRSAVVSDLPYAVRQHEDLSLYHDNGQAKYLESAALESRDDIADIMRTAVARKLG